MFCALSGFHSNFAHEYVDFGHRTFFWAGGFEKGNLVSGSCTIFLPVSKGDL